MSQENVEVVRRMSEIWLHEPTWLPHSISASAKDSSTRTLSTEDDAGDTITPRLIAAGVDRTRIHRQAEEPDGGYAPLRLPDDHAELARTVEE